MIGRFFAPCTWLRGVGVLVLLLTFCLPRPLMAQATGVITGTILAPAGDALPAGLEAELLFLPNGAGPPVITATPVAADGTYRFENVDPATQHRYLVRVTVNGEETLSDLLAFELDQNELTVDITLFAVTTDASALSLGQVNFILDVQDGGWVVAALYRYNNAGAQIITNLTNPPAQIPLPVEARNVQPTEGIDVSNLSETANGIAYAGPFAPGETPIIFSYQIPYQEGAQTIVVPVSDSAVPIRVLVPQLGQTTAIEGLTAQEPQAGPGGRPFELYTTGTSFTESFLTLTFTNLPPLPEGQTPLGSANSDVRPLNPLEQLPRWIPFIPIALALVAVILYIVARPTPGQAEQRASLRSSRDILVAEIAALDIRHETGAVGPQTHQRQRTALKNELKDILRRLGGDAAQK